MIATQTKVAGARSQQLVRSARQRADGGQQLLSVAWLLEWQEAVGLTLTDPNRRVIWAFMACHHY